MNRSRVRKSLDLERERLERVVQAIEGEEGHESQQESMNELSLSDQHPADIGSETFERTKDLGILEQVRAEIADVERAIHRLETGSYGACEACGEPIATERLEALPAARFCVGDQSRAERESRSGVRIP